MDNKKSVILEGLNDAQRQAVEAMEGPVLIVAGAGSGKTRVLTSRVAYMLASGVDPSRILALTFTKKAATEMKERIEALVGGRSARRVVMGTFHAVFVRFLRRYASELGYPEQFTIYDTSDSASAMKNCIKELGLDTNVYKYKEVLSRISSAKNSLVTPDVYATRQDLLQADLRARKPRICDLYKLYQRKLKDAGVMDFDDILVNMNILLRDCPEALHTLGSSFSYIMVDEYQDTNFAQYNIIRKLTFLHHNICVVGDDSQSIYAFRGARVQNIINFKSDFPNCRIIRLEKNYRSTQVIVNAANSVIEHNANRIPKQCYSEAEPGEKIRVVECYSEQDEAARIVSEITSRAQANGAGYGDFAVLYRTNGQSRAIEEALRRRNIPYMIYSGNSFFERKEIKNMMAYFKLVINVHDDQSFLRIVNVPARGIGDTSLEALGKAARAHQTSLFKAIWLDDLSQFGLKGPAISRLAAFGQMISALAARAGLCDAFELASMIREETGYYASVKGDLSQDGVNALSNLDELFNSVAVYVQDRRQEAQENGDEGEDLEISLPDYIENVSLLSNADTDDGVDEKEKVSLMTVHSAKGLEYPFVIIAGMENNLFPSLNSMGSSADVEEERRLFYVALTRAKKSVVITHCESRMRNGKTETNDISMFVKEIDPKYLESPLMAASPSFGSFYGKNSPAYRDRTSRPAFGTSTRPAFGTSTRPSSRPEYRSSTPRFGEPSDVQRFGNTALRRPADPAGFAAKPSATPPAADPNFKADDMNVFRVGQRIEHNRFGAGRILSLSGVAPEIRAEVEFDAYGRKTLLLKYAKMRLLKA